MQDRARRLLMSSVEASIARSAAAGRQQQNRANETPQQQQTRRATNANRQQESRSNETPQQQQTRRTADTNRQQQRRNSNGPLFEAALQCNIDRTNQVADGHLTKEPVESIYSGVVSLRSLRMVVFLSQLNNLEIWGADVGNVLEAVLFEVGV